MATQANLKNIAIWGGANENKVRAPVRWKHDYIIFASYVDKLTVLENPSILIPFIFNKELDEISSKELYDGVFEYKDKGITVELVEGFEYTEYKIFGEKVDFDDSSLFYIGNIKDPAGFADRLLGYSLFHIDDLKDLAGFVLKIRDAGDPLSKYIREQFSDETQQMLDAYENDSYPPPDSLKEALVNKLNKLLKGENLYEEERFLQVKLTKKTKKLIENYPEGEDLIRLNRLLLEEAYPNELEKSQLRDADDPLSKYIREQFSAETKKLLDAYVNDPYPPSDSLKEALVNELNKLLKGENLYEEERFGHVKLTNKTKKLIKNYPEGEDLIRLNRLLLEEAYPNEIENNYFHAIIKRLIAAGAQIRKPEIPIEIHDRPSLVDVEQLNKQRYNYTRGSSLFNINDLKDPAGFTDKLLGYSLFHIDNLKDPAGFADKLLGYSLFHIGNLKYPVGFTVKLRGYSLFRIGNLKDPAGFAVKLRDADDPLSKYIREQFSAETQKLLDAYYESDTLSDSLREALIDELNKLIKSENLYEEERFAQVKLTKKTKELIKNNPKGEELIRLNRLLLEEAYPNEIAKSRLVYTDDPLSKYIREQFSAETKKMLDAYNESDPLPDSLHEALIDELNKLLKGESFYEKERFAHVKLTKNTKELIKNNPEGKNLICLNRMLLEEAYPNELEKSQLRDADDPLSKYIREKFSAETKKLLDEYENDPYPPSDSLKEALIDELNKLLKGESLYEEERFAHVKLTKKTKELIKNNPEGKELIYLNRLLLEEAYPHELEKSRLAYTDDPLLKYTIEQFSAETKKLLDEYENGPYPPSDSLQKALIDELNQLIKGESLYEKEPFTQVKLTKKTKKLIKNNPEGEELLHLNRLLMDAAYPYEIAKDRRDEKFKRDKLMARNMRIKACYKAVFIVTLFAVSIGYLGMEIFFTKYQDVTPEDSMFIAAKGNYVVYSVGTRKIFTVFKFGELVEEIGYDTTYKMKVIEGKEIKDEIIVDKMEDAEGEMVYNRGNRPVVFETDTLDYKYVNANPFTFDSYQEAGDADWNTYGSLERGNAEKIVIRGRVFERDGEYLALLGRTYAVLGTVSEVDSIPQFYDLLGDDISYITVLYSLKAEKAIDLYGRIDKTLTYREGRNSIDKKVFIFHVEYARRVR